jgi:hypothetical protein
MHEPPIVCVATTGAGDEVTVDWPDGRHDVLTLPPAPPHHPQEPP